VRGHCSCVSRSDYERRKCESTLGIFYLRRYVCRAIFCKQIRASAKYRLFSLRGNDWFDFRQRLLEVGINNYLFKSLTSLLVIFRLCLCLKQKQLLLVIHTRVAKRLVYLALINCSVAVLTRLNSRYKVQILFQFVFCSLKERLSAQQSLLAQIL
jgi:hypothetical protein